MSLPRGLPLLVILVSSLSAASYERREMEGWQLHIEQSFQHEHADVLDAVLAELRHQLYQIGRAVAPPALAKLRQVPIWIHYHSQTACMAYHPSAEWLRGHDRNPDMAGGIEIGNGANFLEWTREQPWMVLHELAHAYHHLVLGFENPRVLEAFAAAGQAGIYASVLRINGKKVKAYAMENAKEYFAESSEAFFGTNDFYPFVRAELREADPRMYELLQQLWGAAKR
jgi:hypothetical protein